MTGRPERRKSWLLMAIPATAALGRAAVVVGLAAEARIARRLGLPVAIGGGTTEGAHAAACSLMAEGAFALISFGLAGGLDPALRPGAIIVPSAVIAGGDRFVTDTDLSRMLGGVTDDVMVGAGSVITSVAEKRSLHRQTGATATDLESEAVARVAAARGVPFAVLRAICDPAERALPPAALAALDVRGTIGVWRVAASLVARPGQLPGLLALAADAVAARRSLVARVRQIARARV
jgi:adenosylhomocysteine nucleosidase